MPFISWRTAAAAALLLLTLSSTATAQGRGRGLGRGHRANGAGDPSPGAPAIPGTGARQFGVWLDDATLPPQGKGWMTFGVGYWRSTFGHQWDAPSFDAGLGLSRRVQIGVTAPVSRARYADGSSVSGLGDTYVTVKIGLIDPSATGRSYGLAVAPVIEVLGSGSVPEGDKRVHWALPVAFERRFQRFRAYGAAGYFSRGAVFASAAVEVPANAKVTLTGALSYARSLETDALSDARQLARDRWDVTASGAYALTPTATLFGSVGRTISRLDENASSLALGAGVSLGFQRPPRP